MSTRSLAAATSVSAMHPVDKTPTSNTSPEPAVTIPSSNNVKLVIPLDSIPYNPQSLTPRKLPRRDSLERREALLKGTPGSRQRRRWENDRLLSNPWATPPLPQDWEVRPTYPTRTVPYYLAPLWDAAEFQRSIDSKKRATPSKTGRRKSRSPTRDAAAEHVPKEIRATLKRAKAAKGLLMELEEEVRLFLKKHHEKVAKRREHDLPVDMESSEDEEIVFVGRKAGGVVMNDDSPVKKGRTRGMALEESFEDLGCLTRGSEREKLIFESLAADKGGNFGRWLVHEIGTYYGLRTWSVTTEGEPRMREAYVGVQSGAGDELKASLQEMELPTPLWGMV